MNLLKRFMYEEDGMGTVELVLIVAALVAVAILFKQKFMSLLRQTSVAFLLKRVQKHKTNPSLTH